MEKTNIFEFTDYRAFMKAFYKAKKKAPGSFSYRRFSKLAQNASPNFVKLVVDGQRNLTVQNIYLFAIAMGLLPREKEYFEAMVHYTQETLPEVVDIYLRRMRNLQADTKYLTKNTASFTSGLAENWEKPETWDLICFAPGKTLSQLEEFALGRIPIDVEQIRSIVADALADGILVQSEDEVLSLISDRIKLSQRWKNAQSRVYVGNQIQDSLKASEIYSSKGFAKFSTIIFSVQDLDELEKKVERISQIIAQEFLINDKSKPDIDYGVARMSYQIFPTYLDKNDIDVYEQNQAKRLGNLR